MEHVAASDLIKLASGELPDGTCREIETHLAACEACRGTRADVAAVRGLLGEWTVDAASRDLWGGIEGRLDAIRPADLRPRWHAATRASRVAAAILLGVGLGHVAGRFSWSAGAGGGDREGILGPAVLFAEATADDAAAELGLYVLEMPSSAGLFSTVLEMTDAVGGIGEVTP